MSTESAMGPVNLPLILCSLQLAFHTFFYSLVEGSLKMGSSSGVRVYAVPGDTEDTRDRSCHLIVLGWRVM